VPAGVSELEIGASLGLVFGRTACCVDEARALEYLEGYTIVADISVPHSVFYRPSVRHKARDGFCPIGPRTVPRTQIADPNQLALRVEVDGQTRQRSTTSDMQRPVARLIADVAHGAPRACAGQSAAIEIDGLGRLEIDFVAARETR